MKAMKIIHEFLRASWESLCGMLISMYAVLIHGRLPFILERMFRGRCRCMHIKLRLKSGEAYEISVRQKLTKCVLNKRIYDYGDLHFFMSGIICYI